MIKLQARNSTLLQVWRWRYVSVQTLTHHHHHPYSVTIFQQTPQFNPSSSRYFSTKYYSDNPFTISYLVNSCGLSPESALVAISKTRKLKFKTSARPDCVIEVLQSYGFSKTHIAEVVKKAPFVLVMNPQETLLPKLEFFVSKGFSGSKLTRLIATYPYILKRRLSTFIIPNYEYIKSLLKSERRVVQAIHHYAPLISCGSDSVVDANVQTLRDIKVPESLIAFILERAPKLFLYSPAFFKEVAGRVMRTGFDPSKMQFVIAMTATVFTSESKLEKKFELFEKWGWSEEVTLKACRQYVWSLMVSEEKFTAVMDFLVNQMGLDSFFVAKSPWILSRSLEKVLIPRLAVFKYLLRNGLIKGDAKLTVLLRYPEEKFLDRFVNCYDQAPEILKIYKEKLSM